MASWIDVFAFIFTVTILGAVAYGALFVMQQINDSVQNTKASLKTKGLDVSAQGVSIKTQKRFDREHYVDATQRGFVKAMGASSFGKADDPSSPGSSPTVIHRAPSSSSTKSSGGADHEGKKKRGFFNRAVSSPKEKT